MTRPGRHRTALLLVAAGLGGGVAGCGSSTGLLPGEDATRLEAALDSAESAYDAGRCQDAAAAVREGRERVSGLPASTDDELVRTLEGGFRNLRTRIDSTCEETPTTTEEAPPTTTEEVPTTTEEVPPPTLTEEAPTTTEEAPPTTEDTPAPTTPDSEDGPPLDDDGADQGSSGGGPDVPGATGRALRRELRGARQRLRHATGRGGPR